MIRPCPVRAHVRRTHPPVYVETHLALIAEVRREKDRNVMDLDLPAGIAECVEEDIKAGG